MIEILTSEKLTIIFLNILLGSIATFVFMGVVAIIGDWLSNLRR